MKRITLLTILALLFCVETKAGITNDVAFISEYDHSSQRYVMLLPDKFNPAESHDLLICLHGHGSDRWQFVKEMRDEARAARDIATEHTMLFIAPDYRAKTSWMGPAAEADMIQIIKDLKKQFQIRRIIISGGSMGASSALTFTALHPELVDGVVALNGLADHVSYESFQEAIAASFGGSKSEIPDEYHKRSAINFPERFTMPIAVTAGGKDTSVPPDSVLKLVNSVRKINPFTHVDSDRNRGHATEYPAALKAYRFVIEAPQPLATVIKLKLNGQELYPTHATAAGTWFYTAGHDSGQVLLTGHGTVPRSWNLTAALKAEENLCVEFNAGKEDLSGLKFTTVNNITVGSPAEVQVKDNSVIIRSTGPDCSIQISDFKCGDRQLTFVPQRQPFTTKPVECSPDPLPFIEKGLVEWDWKMQDGISTPRASRSYREASEKLLNQMHNADMDPGALTNLEKRKPDNNAEEIIQESFWLDVHRTRRKIMLSDSRLTDKPLLFIKHVPSVMSHQLTQMYGHCSRPGGGIFLLDQPGRSMKTKNITPQSLEPGNFMTPEISFDAKKLLFAYCPVKEAPYISNYKEAHKHLYYHLYELNIADGSVRPLTKGETDNFFPMYLPGGDILCSSTMRGGFHRCGRGPCPVYTLSRMGANGENPHSISFHETHEWDPCMLNDGRVIYTRWDYVDRNAVHYQHLWSTRPDGSNVRIYYGNNTWNPAGIWEARSIPGSSRIMATASPHHGMSAGSIVLVDTAKGVDGKEPLTRLTPEVRFPESESPLARGPDKTQPFDFDTPVQGFWNSPLKEDWMQKTSTEEELRWPGHCYKSPWPLSENCFITSYSFDRLVGEPGPNIPNMFGIYFADAYGNKELIYRDTNISCLWSRPLTERTPPPELAAVVETSRQKTTTGTFFLSNVMESWPALPSDRPVTHIRIIQMLLKTTPHIDSPKVGVGLGAPGRQVLGTVPVEKDGSAYFEAPARTPMLFQALDEKGRAIQTMRSLVYLQPGENETCIGCHEHRMQKDPPRTQALAIQRAPSSIKPGPAGSKPFCYPLLVQPILDKHCIKCHDGKEPKRPVLSGEPEAAFSKSYNALIKRVSFSAWNNPDQNYEPLTQPMRFGAIASPLSQMMEKGHHNVVLSSEEWESLNTWMDTNGAFYGTFDTAEQKKQLAGEIIKGPSE